MSDAGWLLLAFCAPFVIGAVAGFVDEALKDRWRR